MTDPAPPSYDPMAPTCRPTYPNDTPPEQIEALIDGAATLQRQILRRYTQSVLEEMRYHLWVVQEKCKLVEQECAEQRTRAEKAEACLKDLAFSAETSGGTAGRDEHLCAAIERARKILS